MEDKKKNGAVSADGTTEPSTCSIFKEDKWEKRMDEIWQEYEKDKQCERLCDLFYAIRGLLVTAFLITLAFMILRKLM